MDIIKFPDDKNNANAIVRKDTDPLSKLVIRNMKFTCTECHNQCMADFTGMIFKTIEFYCTECGTFFQISNNVFPKK